MEQASVKAQLRRAYALLAFDIAYLALVTATFIFRIDLAADAAIQYILHFVLIAAAIAYALFVEAIHRAAENADSRTALMFAALFVVPVIIGRGLGIYALSARMTDIWNFYGPVSVSRAIEVLSWTTLFPLSVLFLAKLFLSSKERLLGVLCILSAACCFAAFASIISPEPLFTMIGVMGWGALFLAIILLYIIRAKNKGSEFMHKE